MKWTECAKQDLKRYNHLRESIKNIPNRIESLQYKYESLKGSEAKDESGKYTDILLDNIVERERLQLVYKADKIILELIEKGLFALSENERKVLDGFYITRNGNYMHNLMEDMGYERSRIYQIKDHALYTFTLSMYGLLEY